MLLLVLLFVLLELLVLGPLSLLLLLHVLAVEAWSSPLLLLPAHVLTGPALAVQGGRTAHLHCYGA